ncbi:MAG TPA: hypothetical protein VK337_19565 [Xanthobacteraceae bacterium]|nr:hypothetical protein [Xanthobacteraceae bacterium]
MRDAAPGALDRRIARDNGRLRHARDQLAHGARFLLRRIARRGDAQFRLGANR